MILEILCINDSNLCIRKSILYAFPQTQFLKPSSSLNGVNLLILSKIPEDRREEIYDFIKQGGTLIYFHSSNYAEPFLTYFGISIEEKKGVWKSTRHSAPLVLNQNKKIPFKVSSNLSQKKKFSLFN